MTRATKEDLLAGGEPRPFEVPALGGLEVTLRPLSTIEAERVEAAELAGIRISGEPPAPVPADRKVGQAASRGSFRSPQPRFELDVAEVVKGASESNVLATHYGLVEPAMTIDEVRSKIRPAEAVTQIGEEVKRRSGIGDDAQARIQQFRELAGGTGDAPAPPDGDEAGGDPG